MGNQPAAKSDPKIETGPHSERGKPLVRLNIYDLPNTTALNNCTVHLGFGAFHTGIEIFGLEFSYGLPSGIFMCRPHKAYGCTFRNSVVQGEADVSQKDLVALIKSYKDVYTATNYDMYNFNCHDFSTALSMSLVGKPVPKYINKLAKFVAHFAFMVDGTNFHSQSQSVSPHLIDGAMAPVAALPKITEPEKQAIKDLIRRKNTSMPATGHEENPEKVEELVVIELPQPPQTPCISVEICRITPLLTHSFSSSSLSTSA